MDESIDELFPTIHEAVRAILAEARRLVRESLPEATEIFYHGSLGYKSTPSRFDIILYVMPRDGYVNLGFFAGASVADPLGLLEGAGKRMRHVKLRTVSAAQNPALVPMLRQAWTKGIATYAHLRETRRKRHDQPAER